ncbi:MAG TPA: radical SAM protein [Syntrophales bacterium]|nr:radical SAM protein [Syntrophales bacterium]
MKVAIIAPPYPLEEAPAPPLGVTYVAAAFEKAGADVRIFDYIVNRYTPERLKEQLDRFRPDVVGATSVTLNFIAAADILRTAKRHNPRIVTLIGGPHVSFSERETLTAYPEIDVVVRGEGEKTIPELMPRLEDRRGWESVRGIAFRQGTDIVLTEPQELIEDLNTLPLPARHLLPMSRYQALGYPVSIITGRGCPYACIFCQGRRMVGKKFRQRDASLVVDEIEEILSYGIDRINVADDLFASNRDRVKAVCSEIQKRGLKFSWSAFARANTVDREMLRIMRETGCDSISYGVESGNQEMLDRIKKKITLDMVREAVHLGLEAGMVVHTSFIVGLPGESPETLKETQAFADSLGAMYGYHYLAPFPGTTVREEVDQFDLEILTDDWNRYDANSAIVRTSKISPEEITRFVTDFENEINEAWEKQIRGYWEKTNPPEKDLHVEGFFRTQFVFNLLSKDLIERYGRLPGPCSPEASLGELCARLVEATGGNEEIIRKAMQRFIEAGYIKQTREDDGYRWYWTHNNRVDFNSL